jgi:hypothetical protein
VTANDMGTKPARFNVGAILEEINDAAALGPDR